MHYRAKQNKSIKNNRIFIFYNFGLNDIFFSYHISLYRRFGHTNLISEVHNSRFKYRVLFRVHDHIKLAIAIEVILHQRNEKETHLRDNQRHWKSVIVKPSLHICSRQDDFCTLKSSRETWFSVTYP